MMSLNTLTAENEWVMQQVEAVRRELYQSDFEPLAEWATRPSVRTMIKLLVKRDVVTYAAIEVATKKNIHSEWVDPVVNCRTLACHTRNALRSLGIELQTVWGHGYSLKPSDRATLRKLAKIEQPVSIELRLAAIGLSEAAQ